MKKSASRPPTLSSPPATSSPPADDLPFVEAKSRAVTAFERDYLVRLMARTKDSVTAAARLAGIDRTNFRRMLQRHGIRSGAHHVACGCRVCNGRDAELHVLKQSMKAAKREIARLLKQLRASESAQREYILALED